MNFLKTKSMLATPMEPSSNIEHITSLTASDKDSASRFSSGQARWNALSGAIISDIAAHESTSFKDYLIELADIRHAIAEQLHQYEEKNDFGVFRSETYECWEIFLQNGTGGWATQGPIVNKKIEELLTLEALPETCEKNGWRAGEFEDGDGGKVLVETLEVRVPYGHEKTETEIMRISYPGSDKSSWVRLDYHYVNKHSIERTYNEVNIHWQNLVNWDKTKGLDEFLITAAKIAYIMVHTMPLKRGTSAIVDWMIRGQAEKHGISLGQYNHKSDELSWPLKALVSADMDLDQYAEWYKNNAFSTVALQQEVKMTIVDERQGVMAQEQNEHDKKWGLVVTPEKQHEGNWTELHSVATLIKHHGMLSSASKEEVLARKQHEHDQKLGIVLVPSSFIS